MEPRERFHLSRKHPSSHAGGRVDRPGAGADDCAVRDGEPSDRLSEVAPAPPIAAPRRATGRVVARAVMWSLPLLAIVAGVLYWLQGGRHVTTDNAYVKGDRAVIAAEVSGVIVEVAVAENQRVSRGQLLFRLDEQPHRLALARIEAELESARAEIRGLKVAWRQKREEIKAAQSKQTFAAADYDRQQELARRRIASTQRLEESRRDLDVARQRIASLEEELARIETQLVGDRRIHPDDHPRVKQLAATRDEVLLNLRRTQVEAPLAGIVARRPLPGGYVTAGQPVMAVVADGELWIEANFKETELTRVRAGQPVTIRVDTYPDVVWQGTVASIAQATGAEFAVLPPQNATGNWVKVVQRIAVRIDLRRPEGDPPLRVGMSFHVAIDTGHSRTIGDLFAGLGRALGFGSGTATARDDRRP